MWCRCKKGSTREPFVEIWDLLVILYLSSSNFFITQKNYQTLLHSDTLISDVWKPYLVFEYVITTHKFNPTNYSKDISHRENLHKEIMKLHNKGWGYTKIHRHLMENGFQIGKSRTTVDSIIKKIKKRNQFLNQSIYKSGFQDFRVRVFQC